jgi:hypothetical protein
LKKEKENERKKKKSFDVSGFSICQSLHVDGISTLLASRP